MCDYRRTFVLACLLSSVWSVNAQADGNPTALEMASLLMSSDRNGLTLITSGKYAPSFRGPPNSAKIIKSWTVPANDHEKKYLPGGAVKLQTPTGAKGALVELKFAAVSRVRKACLPGHASTVESSQPSRCW
jgi:hypothetical protein